MPYSMPTDELTPEQRDSLKTEREVIDDILALPALDDGSILMLPAEVQALRERMAATAPVPKRVGDAFFHGWLLKTYPNGDVLVSAPNYEPAAMMIDSQELLTMIANINKAMDEDGDIKAVGACKRCERRNYLRNFKDYIRIPTNVRPVTPSPAACSLACPRGFPHA